MPASIVKPIVSPADLKSSIKAKGAAVVQFISPKCRTCESGTELLNRYSKEEKYARVRFLVVDSTVLKGAATKYKVTPGLKATVIFFKDGKEMKRVQGQNIRNIEEGLAAVTGSGHAKPGKHGKPAAHGAHAAKPGKHGKPVAHGAHA